MHEVATMISGYAGWLGAAGTMGAYGLVSQRRLDASSVTYQVTNAVGAGLLALSALSADNWPSLAANLVWMVIAVLSLGRAARVLRDMPGAWAHGVLARASSRHERRLSLQTAIDAGS
jgi:hypothetical protein